MRAVSNAALAIQFIANGIREMDWRQPVKDDSSVVRGEKRSAPANGGVGLGRYALDSPRRALKNTTTPFAKVRLIANEAASGGEPQRT